MIINFSETEAVNLKKAIDMTLHINKLGVRILKRKDINDKDEKAVAEKEKNIKTAESEIKDLKQVLKKLKIGLISKTYVQKDHKKYILKQIGKMNMEELNAVYNFIKTFP